MIATNSRKLYLNARRTLSTVLTLLELDSSGNLSGCQWLAQSHIVFIESQAASGDQGSMHDLSPLLLLSSLCWCNDIVQKGFYFATYDSDIAEQTDTSCNVV